MEYASITILSIASSTLPTACTKLDRLLRYFGRTQCDVTSQCKNIRETISVPDKALQSRPGAPQHHDSTQVEPDEGVTS